MKIKRFQADSTHEAMRQVREQLGADAIVLSTEKNAQGVEIIAALDFDPDALEASVNEQQRTQSELDMERLESMFTRVATDVIEQQLNSIDLPAKIHAELEPVHASIATLQAVGKSDRSKVYNTLKEQIEEIKTTFEQRLIEQHQFRNEGVKILQQQINELRIDINSQVPEMPVFEYERLEKIQDEIVDLKDIVGCQTQLMDWANWAKRNPNGLSFVSRLGHAGFGISLCKKVVSAINDTRDADNAWNRIVTLLATGIEVPKHEGIVEEGVLVLLGPTGVGKTTTLAKIAAHFAMQHGNDEIALINIDNYRIGGHEQLATYAKILNVPSYNVKSAANLKSIIPNIRNKKLVLIDTAGKNVPDETLKEYIQMLKRSRLQPKKLLLLGASTQLHTLRQTVKDYGVCGIDGCVITKTDEASQLGNALTVAIEDQIPVWLETFGQRVPEDLRKAQSALLVQRAIDQEYEIEQEEQNQQFLLDGWDLHANNE